jgi:small subunit ribosomal protein S9
MMEEPEQPEGETPEDETPEGVPGEPGEATPAEPDELVDAEPAELETPGPEIEGLEELGEGEQPAEAPAGEQPAEPAAEEQPADAGGEEPADAAEPPEAQPAEPAGEAPAEAAEGEQQPAEQAQAARERGSSRRGRGGEDSQQEDVIPGAHLEPDLVLEEQRSEGEFGEYDQYADADAPVEEAAPSDETAEPAPVAHTPLELAADARYHATGKRKSAIARVILKPGEGTYSVNGRHLDEYFPRVRLQRLAHQPLEAAGYDTRMDVVARIHGGGVSAQANALRHGIARALVEADPALRAEMKRRGYLTRDPRQKERKKAGLKKARKRPQFSKR